MATGKLQPLHEGNAHKTVGVRGPSDEDRGAIYSWCLWLRGARSQCEQVTGRPNHEKIEWVRARIENR